VLAQTYTDFELTVVDDGSTDDSGLFVYNSSFPVRYIKQNNLGPGAARNNGVTETTSEFVAFLDADDEWHPRFLENSIALLDILSNESVAAVFSGYFEGPKHLVTERRWRAAGLETGIVTLTPKTPAPYVISLLNYMNAWSMVMRRDAFERNGGFYAKDKCIYAEDSYLWLKVLMREESIFIHFIPLVWWHNEDSGLSKNLTGMRPIEPFLSDSLGLRVNTPTHMLSVLDEVLALRAAKTAAVLSFWGQWQTAQHLLQVFPARRNARQKIVIAAKLAANPLGALAGSMARFVLATRRASNVRATTLSK